MILHPNTVQIAIGVGDEVLSQKAFAGKRHSELLLPMLHELLAQAELSLEKLDGIAFGAGPGSFTGLRVACGVAQGLAFGLNLPVIGISTLKALAAQINNENVITAIDARMGEIYHAAYIKSKDNWKTVSMPNSLFSSSCAVTTGEVIGLVVVVALIHILKTCINIMVVVSLILKEI